MLQTRQVLQERYQLLEQLGRTGAGRQTWLAIDLQSETQEQVIVKLLAFNPQMQWDDVKLFERESLVLQNLDHPRIPHYRDYFAIAEEEGAGLPWFALVQDYIPGQSLQEKLDVGKLLTETRAKYLAEDVLEILIYLHELSPPVFHRDIKPSNLIFGSDKKFYLVDFGAVQDRAKAEGASFTVVGTSGYAAPEQLWGKTVAASDLYSLGATLVHLLTGAAPAELPQRNLQIQFSDRVSLSPEFTQWLERMLHPNLEHRFTNAREAAKALRHRTSSQRYSSNTEEKPARYLRLAMLSAVGLAIAGFPIFSIFLFAFSPGYRPTPSTTAQFQMQSINNFQKNYFKSKGRFVDQDHFAELGTGLPLKTEDYIYTLQLTPTGVLHQAIPRTKNLLAYVGGVFAAPAELLDDEAPKNKRIPLTVLCEVDVPEEYDGKLPKPSLIDGLPHCPPGTAVLDGSTYDFPYTEKQRRTAHTVILAQKKYFAQHNAFTDSQPELSLEIKPQTPLYQFSLQATPKAAFSYSIARRKGFPSYISGIVAVPESLRNQMQTAITSPVSKSAAANQPDKLVTIAFICRTDNVLNPAHLPQPSLKQGQVSCPADGFLEGIYY